ncbi:MAG: bifunctional (p)ppGpp synthetase/guanosine-3',5'-bis(diphosphate) 3'-pyrophosphohydrolase [Candidatus Doudnabacteria bacterium]|nr:bifunctional (p)ppGpp synthetase/guanosine-3',5'-bis(diphosphate) 3'-pyrophosphohydrolase [Candidatus Doudnabacteria bacterium]
MSDFNHFLKSIPHRFTLQQEELLKSAFECAKEAHKGQKRKSGSDYFEHSQASSVILGKIFPDPPTLTATLMHDVPEDTSVSLEKIKETFGKEIAGLVDGVTQLGHVRMKNSQDKFYVENLRKLFIATSRDVRVILIKLADRLHNMRTIEFISPEKQKKVAKETLEIYAPIAGRLGIGGWKDELEDLAFHIVYPEEYQKTKALLDEELTKRSENLKIMQKSLEHNLRKQGIKFLEVRGRVKRPYSLFKKMEKYKDDIAHIYDIIALRIITRSTVDCYATLGAIHKAYQPVPGRIKDYISTPKPNGYQSIHTSVFCKNGMVFEIQIRTDLMDEESERGIAAHWFYSEQEKGDRLEALRTNWAKELKAWQEAIESPEEFLENLKIDFFKDRIFVFTPKGDIKDLPLGATVIDFAFSVHTDLGYHMMGAKINGKMGSIYDMLKKGDVIEILKSKQPAKISRDWLEAASTHNAKNRIRHYLSEHDKGIIDRIKQLKLADLKPSLPRFFRKK